MAGTGDAKGLRRFYTPLIDTEHGVATIEGEELLHLRRVLRLRPGDWLVVLDGRGGAFKATIVELSAKRAIARLSEPISTDTESPLHIILLQAILKGDRNGLVVQKATELGIKEIVLFTTSRTVPRLTEQRIYRLKKRLERMAIEGIKQCGRLKPPQIEIVGFEQALRLGSRAGLRLILHEGARGSARGLLRGSPSSVALAVGPEGGFSEDELALAKKLGYRQLCLGPRVLRSDTMGIVAPALVQFLFGDMGRA